MPESEIDYIVVRCSKGSITNLHLNNKAHWWNELSLPEVVRQQIYFQCQEAVQSLDLQYAGVDVLIERGTDIPYIIEVNGQEIMCIRICLLIILFIFNR